jgi:glycine hydroxymethyltransferase
MVELFLSLLDLIKKHNEWRLKNSINLISSENILSPEARALLAIDFAGRYTSRESFYRGTRYMDEIENIGIKVAKDLFKAEYADLRALSGHIATLAFLASNVKENETILCVSPEDGGYPGMAKNALPKFLRINVEYLPFNKEEYIIDVDATLNLIEKVKPSFIIFDFSLILRKQPVQEIYSKIKDKEIKIAYDGSHVLGLIAGGEFQDPLREGAVALYGSTHKSFFGPQGGIILSNKEIGDKIDETIFPSIVDNAHWNRIASLTLALIEMKEFGKEYAKQVINNSKRLAKSLLEFGLPIKGPRGILTESHQVYLNFASKEENQRFAIELEKVNIITDSAIRLGTNEVTRLGMKEKDMDIIAELIYRTYKKEDSEKIRSEVIKLKSEFNEIHFRFNYSNLEEIFEIILNYGY